MAAIVILNYNGATYLKEFLPTVISFSEGHSIYVADNASTDTSLEVLSTFGKRIDVISLPKNVGFAEGYNQALAQIDHEEIILLNSDVLVTENWIDPCLHRLNSSPKIVAVQPKIKSYHTPNEFEYAGAAGGSMDFLGYPFCRGRIFDTCEKDTNQYNDALPIFWATGACMFIKKSAFHEIGGFDGLFFAHMEEIDLCWRWQRAGFSIFYEPESSVYHVGGGTLSVDNPFKTYLNFRNNLAMLYKNLAIYTLVPIIFARLCLDGIAGIRLLLQGKPKLMWAIVQAHGGFYKLLFALKREGNYNVNLRTIYRKSILWEYFMNKKRTFNQLKFK
ncbi:MAG: glycosyltransferase [Spirosomataceae bacterium]